jgi:hypothetical protein
MKNLLLRTLSTFIHSEARYCTPRKGPSMSAATSLSSLPYRALASLAYSLRVVFIATLGCLAFCTPAWAVSIDFDNGTVVINDGGIGDLNGSAGIIDFNQTIAGYKMTGTVDTTVGPSLVSLLGSPTAALRLTNFTAEAIGSPSASMPIQFYDTPIGVFPSVTAADSLDAYAVHATGLPIVAGNDFIDNWQGFISGAIITGVLPGPPPYFNPAVPAFSLPLPYTAVTHGPVAMGAFVNPVFGAYFSFFLGSNGDQLYLPSSADVGFLSVPEPNSLVLVVTGLLGLAICGRRLRMR